MKDCAKCNEAHLILSKCWIHSPYGLGTGAIPTDETAQLWAKAREERRKKRFEEYERWAYDDALGRKNVCFDRKCPCRS